MTEVRQVAILGGNRIPFARAGGRYARTGSIDLLTAALDGLVARFDLAGERPGEVAAGAGDLEPVQGGVGSRQRSHTFQTKHELGR